MERFRKVLRAKIHRATVTAADLDYEGSIAIPEDLMRSIDLYEFEAVKIWNVTSGTRLETYAIRGLSGSGDICVNGAAAHLVNPGDIVIIAAFAWMDEREAMEYKPLVAFVDSKNRLVEKRQERLPFSQE